MAGKLDFVRRYRAIALCGWSRGALATAMPARKLDLCTRDFETIKAIAHLTEVAA